MDLCETPLTTGCPSYLALNSTAGVLPEFMLRLHIIVLAVTVFGLIVLGTLLGMVIYVLRRPQAMAELGVVEGGKGKWYEDSESGSEGTGCVNGSSAPTTAEARPTQHPKQPQQKRQSQERTAAAQRQQRAEREKELPPPLQLRRLQEPASMQRGPETEREMEPDMQHGMAGMSMGVDSMEIIRGSRDTALVWANFGPPPKMSASPPSRVPSSVLLSPPPIPSSQRPTTRSLVPPTRPYRAPNRNTYPNQQQPPPVHLQPPPIKNLTQSHSQPEMRQREYPYPLPSQTESRYSQQRNLTESRSQPEMRQRERGHITFVTRLEYPIESELGPSSKWERPGLGLGLGIRQSFEQERSQPEKGKGKERERLVVRGSRRFSLSQNF